MSDKPIDADLHASIPENEQHPRSSPARRTAACHSDIALVGRSQAFIEVMRQVDRVSNTNLPVLLTGEAGTGKQLIASVIHSRSRADKPFLVLNCGAISEDTITWEAVAGGTLFLNDVTEATPSFQATLLRVLETGDVRVIAASNRNVEQEAAVGRFCNDLFQRLSAAAISLPPLRERSEDIPPLAQTFADRVYLLGPRVKFSSNALALMERYSWPGNIRELENTVVRAVAMCDGRIRVKDLPERVRNYTQQHYEGVSAETTSSNGNGKEEWVTLSEIEGRYVAQVLEHTRGNKQAAARVLAVDRKTLDRMIKRHHIDSERVRRLPR